MAGRGPVSHPTRLNAVFNSGESDRITTPTLPDGSFRNEIFAVPPAITGCEARAVRTIFSNPFGAFRW